MAWSDLRDLHRNLANALSAYNWPAAAGFCALVIAEARSQREPIPAADARAILEVLRKKRRFELITMVAEAFILSGQTAPRVRRHYAQALIDQGLLVAPEPFLAALAEGPDEGDSQVAEARGLLGRLNKQRFIEAGRDTPVARNYFERALTEYLRTYRLDPQHNYWHGINAVALLRRAQIDGLPLHDAPDPDVMARDILASVRYASGSAYAFELATRLEALVALGDTAGAEAAALEYTRHPDADAFEVASTLRQLEQVWRLDPSSPPGSTVLPLLRAAKLRGENGSMTIAPADVAAELQAVSTARARLEKVFGIEKTVTVKWYQTGLDRTKAVARIERLNGRGHGTGWLVRAEDFFPERKGVLLLTNAHVINQEGLDGALPPDLAQANFQALGRVVRFEDTVVWSSPPHVLDATFLEFRGDPPAVSGLPLWTRKVRLAVPAPLVYTMGHPDGRDLELSLHDNKLLGCNDRLLHYRTPTEGGSSGSPLFEETDWQVIGLHHAGGTFDRLDGGTPPYEANEGIAINALRAATRALT